MVAITRAFAASMPAGERAGRSSPELDANLRTCRAQMMDWVTCPSAKTPEGKAKIAQISSKLESIKHEIRESDGALPFAANSPPAVPSTTAASAGAFSGYFSKPAQVGANVDTYG